MWRLLRRTRPKDPGEIAPTLSVEEALLAERPSDIFMAWAISGQLRDILPDLDALRGISQLPAHRDDAFIHTLKVVDAIEGTRVRRWSALLHDIGKAPTYIETPEGRSRFFEHERIGAVMVPEIMSPHVDDPKLIQDVTRIVSLHMRPISYSEEWSDAAVRRLQEDAEDGRGSAGWDDLMALARADLRGYLPEPIDRGLWVLDCLEERRSRLFNEANAPAQTGPQSPLDGHEILALGSREPGPWVGELKTFLQDAVENGSLGESDKQAAAEMALRWIAANL